MEKVDGKNYKNWCRKRCLEDLGIRTRAASAPKVYRNKHLIPTREREPADLTNGDLPVDYHVTNFLSHSLRARAWQEALDYSTGR